MSALRRRHAHTLAAQLAGFCVACASAGGAWASEREITALGRIEPQGGVIRVAGPSGGASVIAGLEVDEGDLVTRGQKLAVLDSHARSRAELARVEAELENAGRELQRTGRLQRGGAAAGSTREDAELAVRVAEARLAAARADLELSIVRSPIDGQVLEIHAREGERVGPEGIAELGRTSSMYAVAEVYETDVRRVSVGNRAIVSSPALGQPIHGRVEHIGLKIGKADVLDTDPAAKTDARVVEVDVRLDESEAVSGLTHLQVVVTIEP